MLTGSTSGFRSFLCRPFARGCSMALLPYTTSSAPQCVMQKRKNGDSPAANSHRGVRGTLCSVRPSATPGTATILVDKVVKVPVGTDLFLNYQQHGRVPPTRRPYITHQSPARKCPSQRRRTLLWVMLTAKSSDRAWSAYQELLSHQVTIPNHLLHQLARLLVSAKPRTRTVYLQLLSVLRTLQRNRGRLRLWEWNTLMDCAGKQWHKTRVDDYENSLAIFNRRGVLPAGNTAVCNDEIVDSPCQIQQEPDIWTYNILLSIASRTNSPVTVRHASSLLLASGLLPNRYSHLCLLRYFATRKDLRNVRSTLHKMKQQELEVGLDGINACLWAYAQSGRFDIALRIYRVLRAHVNTSGIRDHDIDEDSRYIRDTVGLDNLASHEPDEITYRIMIQTLAYHGDLRNALGVFVDMLSTLQRGSDDHRDGQTINSVCYKPSMAAFRALFLGFARHGQSPVETKSTSVLFPLSEATWDQDSLEAILAAFLRLPNVPKPTDRLVYWILIAFDKTSGNDAAKLREVWSKLEAKYGGGWGGRLEQMRESIFIAGDDESVRAQDSLPSTSATGSQKFPVY